MLNLFVLHSVRMKYYIRVWKKDQVHVCVWECVITCQTLASPKYQKNQNKQKKNSFLFHCLSLSPFFHLLWLWDNKCLVNAWQRLKSELRWKSFVIKSCLPHQNIKRDISLSCNYHFNFLTFTPPATVDVCHCHVTPAWIPAFGIFPAALPCNQMSFFLFCYLFGFTTEYEKDWLLTSAEHEENTEILWIVTRYQFAMLTLS